MNILCIFVSIFCHTIVWLLLFFSNNLDDSYSLFCFYMQLYLRFFKTFLSVFFITKVKGMTIHFYNQVQNEMACLDNTITHEKFNTFLLPSNAFLNIYKNNLFFLSRLLSVNILYDMSSLSQIILAAQQCNYIYNTFLGSSIIICFCVHNYCSFTS